jgi:hypothetical protein
MPIRHMQRFAELRRHGDATMGERRVLLEAHRDEVLARIAELQTRPSHGHRQDHALADPGDHP